MGKAEINAMDEAVRIGEAKATAAKKELAEFKEQTAEREQLIAQAHQIIGRVQANTLMAKFANVSNLVHLKNIKESKIYRDLPAVGTWDKYCEYLGLSRQKVDEDLLNLAAFGEDFLTTCQQFSLGYRDLRKLRQLSHDGSITIEADAVIVDGETIPLDADHKEDLQAAIEKIIETAATAKEESSADLAAKDRVLQAKEDVIKKQEKELAKYDREAKKKGLTPEEDAFLQRMENSRTIMDGFLMEFDPERNPLPDDATPRMKAAYMETIGYLKRGLDAAHDTAADYYGDAELDGSGWVPPHLRKENDN